MDIHRLFQLEITQKNTEHLTGSLIENLGVLINNSLISV
jgi:hypothetical protein